MIDGDRQVMHRPFLVGWQPQHGVLQFVASRTRRVRPCLPEQLVGMQQAGSISGPGRQQSKAKQRSKRRNASPLPARSPPAQLLLFCSPARRLPPGLDTLHYPLPFHLLFSSVPPACVPASPIPPPLTAPNHIIVSVRVR